MGNCQAIDAASMVIQHPSGRIERYYWPMTVAEVMRLNQGHYVALVITLSLSPSEEEKAVSSNAQAGVRFTRVKLLRPTETLILGQAYRLITSDEVMKGLWEKKYAKMKKKKELESPEKQSQRVHDKKESGCEIESRKPEQDNMNKPVKHERHRQKTSSSSLARSRMWRPSLQSISEATYGKEDKLTE